MVPNPLGCHIRHDTDRPCIVWCAKHGCNMRFLAPISFAAIHSPSMHMCQSSYLAIGSPMGIPCTCRRMRPPRRFYIAFLQTRILSRELRHVHTPQDVKTEHSPTDRHHLHPTPHLSRSLTSSALQAGRTVYGILWKAALDNPLPHTLAVQCCTASHIFAPWGCE